jgi:hypothetical protein
MSPTTSTRRWRGVQLAFFLLAFSFAAMGYWLYDISQQQTEDRRNGALTNCRNNQAQDNVLRAILRSSVESDDPTPPAEAERLRHTYERVLGRTPGDKSLKEMRLELVEHLMEPLGGYRTNTEEQRNLCEKRLRESGLEP